ncbi:hypothetical protein CSUI_001566 [Cystoisospora suis]|uniref:Transmembrane protein n=1 Tax=Cystoisospora suis TaxID=483139 RepID=A0A2C6KKK9_9APIC|nr:hypothetical protein CSUI_001566 [Cystoisospora suis]
MNFYLKKKRHGSIFPLCIFNLSPYYLQSMYLSLLCSVSLSVFIYFSFHHSDRLHSFFENLSLHALLYYFLSSSLLFLRFPLLHFVSCYKDSRFDVSPLHLENPLLHYSRLFLFFFFVFFVSQCISLYLTVVYITSLYLLQS